MPIDAFIHLDRLRCIAEFDATGHSEPYAWTILLWIDDTTLDSPSIVGSKAPDLPRVVIKEGIKAGQNHGIPSFQQTFAHRFETDQRVRTIGIVVVLFEEDETPSDAVRAAYRAFVRELPKAVAEFISNNLRGPETDAERAQIAAAVDPKVREAGKDALSTWEKIQVKAGLLNLDDQIGLDSFFADVEEGEHELTTFTLRFEKVDPFGGRNEYEITARFELHDPSVPDPCQAMVDRVTQANAVVAAIEATLLDLREKFIEAAPEDKEALRKEIRRVREEELPGPTAALSAAKRALTRCRAREAMIGDRPSLVADPLGGLLVPGPGA